MFSVSTGSLARIASALLSGDDNAIDRLVEKAVERAGEKLIEQIISATPLGAAFDATQRIGAAVATGGVSEMERLRQQWLNSIRPPSGPMTRGFRKIDSFLRKTFATKAEHTWHRRGVGPWAQSREQWLSEGWQHDWRSQPRNRIGEWIPGRLPYPVTGVTYGKPPVSRRLQQLRKRRRAWRAAGRQIIRSSWSNS